MYEPAQPAMRTIGLRLDNFLFTAGSGAKMYASIDRVAQYDIVGIPPVLEYIFQLRAAAAQADKVCKPCAEARDTQGFLLAAMCARHLVHMLLSCHLRQQHTMRRHEREAQTVGMLQKKSDTASKLCKGATERALWALQVSVFDIASLIGPAGALLEHIPGAETVLSTIHVDYLCLVMRQAGGSMSAQAASISASLPPCTIIPGAAPGTNQS